MVKDDKRERRIRRNTRNVSPEDFEWIINRHGKIIRGKSHPKAHIGNHVYPYKRENPIKLHYVETVLKFIDEMKGR